MTCCSGGRRPAQRDALENVETSRLINDQPIDDAAESFFEAVDAAFERDLVALE